MQKKYQELIASCTKNGAQKARSQLADVIKRRALASEISRIPR